MSYFGKIHLFLPKSILRGNAVAYGMQTVTLDKTGKIYLPKKTQGRMKSREFYVLSLPDGTLVLHPKKHPKDALKEFQKVAQLSKPLSRIKKEILLEAVRESRHVRGH